METKNTALKGGMLKCVIFLFCYIVFIKILPYFLHNPNYQCAMYIVMGIAGLLISLPELKEAGASWKAYPVRNVLLIIGGFIVMNIIDNLAIIPYALLYSEQAGSINDSNLEVARQLAEPVVLVLGAGILGPIVEETVFRSILMRKQGDFIPKAVVVYHLGVLPDAGQQEIQDTYHIQLRVLKTLLAAFKGVAQRVAGIIDHTVVEIALLGALHLDSDVGTAFGCTVNIVD
jgi:hypothetical protein